LSISFRDNFCGDAALALIVLVSFTVIGVLLHVGNIIFPSVDSPNFEDA
jgi:hypothetical protein